MSNEKKFQILVCIDGSESSYSGLRYAVRMGADHTADLTLLFVRPLDQGLGSGGLQMDIARENMLNWGHDLPGMRALKRGRNMLVEMGFMEDSWKEQVVHTDVRGDKLGDNSIIYTNEDGAKITLEMMVSPSVERGILDEIEIAVSPYGTPCDLDMLKRYRDAGVDQVILFALSAEPDKLYGEIEGYAEKLVGPGSSV